MEPRQPDEPNEPRIDPSSKQPAENQSDTNRPADAQPQPSPEQPSAGEQNDAPRGDAPQETTQKSPNQRGNRQQRGRGNRNDGPRTDAPRSDAPRNDRNGGPRDGGPEPRPDSNAELRESESGTDGLQAEIPNEQNTAPRGDGPRGDRRDRGQRDGGPRGDAPRGDGRREDGQRGGGKREAAPRGDAPRSDAPRNDRNENRPNRDRPASTRERGTDNRTRDDRSFSEMPDSDDLRGADGQENQTTEFQGRDDRLVIGISLGDYNGIGPEVILKALQNNRLQKICTPVVYGSMRILNRYRNLLDMKDWTLNGAPTIGQISHKLTNVITCWPDQSQDIQPGQVTPDAGQAALACLQRAVDDLKAGQLDALVTAPINKYNIQSEEFQFPGHTEYLAQQFDVADNLMFMVSNILRVGVVTGHVPLGRVRQNVTRERIAQKLALMMQSLKQDFGIEKPKIAVLGLNPHAGEEGLLGNEEQDIIIPLLTDLRNKGQLVFGPYPADGFFGTRNYRNFDAVLAMYHDQGLIPFKAIAFEEGVNFTAGMPVVRTSPDHGTAYDIAGKNLADETSMLQAIYTAIDVARQRKEFLELEAGALRKQSTTK